MAPYGTMPCDILFIGESPGYTEDRMKRPYWHTAPAGAKLAAVLKTSQLDQFSWAMTNVIRCRQEDDRHKGVKPTPAQLTACRPFVQADITRAAPKMIVLLGAVALKSVLGKSNITKHRGQHFRVDGQLYFCTYHPEYVVRDPRFEATFLRDMTSARLLLGIEIGESDGMDAMRARYEIVRDEARLDALLAIADTRPFLGFDTEFWPLDPLPRELTGEEQPRICYMVTLAWVNDDKTITSIAIPVDHPESPFKDQQHIKDKIAVRLRAKKLRTHNAEADVETALLCFGIPLTDLTIDFDTMAASLAIHGPSASHALKTLVMTDAPDIAGYEREVDTFITASTTHRGALARWDKVEAILGTLATSRAGKKTAADRDKISKKEAELTAERAELQPKIKAVAEFVAAHDGAIFDTANYDYGTIPLEMLGNPYAVCDGVAVLRLTRKYLPTLRAQGQERFFYLILNRAWRLNMTMRRNGLLLDWDQWAWRYTYYKNAFADVNNAIRAIPEVAVYAHELEAQKKIFNAGSDDQMHALMFTVLQLPTPAKKTDKGLRWKMDRNALLEVKAQKNHPVLDLLSERSKIEKILSTYLEGYIAETNSKGNRVLYADGRVHSRFHNFTESTRRGSSAPNSQNTTSGDPFNPVRKTLTANLKANYPDADEDTIEQLMQPMLPDNMRMLFRAPPGKKFVSFDFGQLEFRLAACYANDAAMIEGCRTGDPHGRVQERFRMREVNGIMVLDPTGALMPRKPAKKINFSVLYGCEAPRLQQGIKEDCGLNWDLDFCQDVITGMFDLYSGLKRWIRDTHAFIREHGYVQNALGKIRWLPQAQTSDDPYMREEACRQGLNDLCQSLGHHLLEIAMQEMLDLITTNKLDWKINNDTHDGFLMEVPEAEVGDAIAIGKHKMEEVPKRVLGDWLQVPLGADASFGDHFGNLKGWKSV